MGMLVFIDEFWYYTFYCCMFRVYSNLPQRNGLDDYVTAFSLLLCLNILEFLPFKQVFLKES